jgi:hypothetical protein
MAGLQDDKSGGWGVVDNKDNAEALSSQRFAGEENQDSTRRTDVGHPAEKSKAPSSRSLILAI